MKPLFLELEKISNFKRLYNSLDYVYTMIGWEKSKSMMGAFDAGGHLFRHISQVADIRISNM